MLLDGLLAYSRVGRTEVRVEQVDLGEVVRDMLPLAGAAGWLRRRLRGNVAIIRTHRTSILVVLENLIGNALETP